MKGIESMGSVGGETVRQPEPSEESIERAAVKDYLFDQYMKQQLITDFFDVLSEDLDHEHVDAMRGVLSEYSDTDVYAALSLPHELRARKFSEFKNKIEEDDQDPRELMRALVEVSKKYKFGIGYHTSPFDIRPNTKGEWVIKGTENDHRDNDVNMAYYSTKYRHLFRKKNPNYVYIVRTEPTTHKTDGIWSRAGSLSVIARVPFGEVVDYVERTAQTVPEEENEDKEKTADATSAVS